MDPGIERNRWKAGSISNTIGSELVGAAGANTSNDGDEATTAPPRDYCLLTDDPTPGGLFGVNLIEGWIALRHKNGRAANKLATDLSTRKKRFLIKKSVDIATTVEQTIGEFYSLRLARVI